ncbi:MAG: MFS transporter [Limnochordaceae bacterium]|nr:MFS transporter [Limnochordaceae bacterium]
MLATSQPLFESRAGGSVFASFRHRNFRLFWFGQLVSLMGTWMQTIGQAWLVLQLTNSPMTLGLIGTVQFLPVTFLALWTGVLVDRYDKRRLVIATQTGMALLALILWALVWSGWVRLWHVFVLAVLLGILNALDIPSRQSFIVEMVGKEDLLNAIALNSSAFNGARLVGPALAGFVIDGLGVAPTFLLNAFSFGAVILGLLAMDVSALHRGGAAEVAATPSGKAGMVTPLEPRVEVERPDPHPWRAVVQAYRCVAARPAVSSVLILIAVVSTFAMNFNVSIPVLARNTLAAGASGYGVLMSAMGAGALIGSLLLAGTRRPHPSLWLGGAAGFGASLLLVALFAGYKWFWPTAVALFVAGACMITFTATSNTSIQVNVPDSLRGRVMGFYTLVFTGVTPIGSTWAGWLTGRSGAPVALAWGAGISLIAVVFINVWLRWRVRQLQKQQQQQAPAAL